MTRTLALVFLALALPAAPAPAQAWNYVASPRLRIRTLRPRPTVVAQPRVVARPAAAPSTRQAPARAAMGSLACRATRNGVETRATIALMRGGRSIVNAACGLGAAALSAPSGSYIARVTLAGTLDGTHRDVPVRLVAGQLRGMTVEVPTALLEVRAEVSGRRVFGRAIVRRGGTAVGSLGSGVVATLSPGTYDIEVIHGAARRLIRNVSLRPGQRRAVRVAF